MWIIALVPFVMQSIVILLDEAIFHVKRGLPKWERIGHPLDTFTVLLCMGYVIWIPFSRETLCIYVLLAIFSSIFVTKDEFVHKAHCPACEQWLHALLFVLHPITLTVAGFIWPVIQGIEVAPWITEWLDRPDTLRLFLYVQLSAMSIFCVYQIVFWNIFWKEKL